MQGGRVRAKSKAGPEPAAPALPVGPLHKGSRAEQILFSFELRPVCTGWMGDRLAQYSNRVLQFIVWLLSWEQITRGVTLQPQA